MPTPPDLGRRAAIARGALALAGAFVAGCRLTDADAATDSPRLQARPGTPTTTGPTGLQPLGVGGARDGLLWVPPTYTATKPLPLLLLLHGAGGSATGQMTPHQLDVQSLGLEAILVAPDSRGPTWDAIRGSFVEDVAFIDEALRRVYARYAVDARRVAVAGFSDGATYAIALARANGDALQKVIAYSPGFLIDVPRTGRPEFFVTHGTADSVLPINDTSRVLVPRLKADGYRVDYREWEGPHAVNGDLRREGIRWVATG